MHFEKKYVDNAKPFEVMKYINTGNSVKYNVNLNRLFFVFDLP